ncbi:hypothetical protein IWQ55_000287 [Labrenzia sp. EL_208]|nr:hypothetical protein [Labrenzia sp. EL_132]MBG6227095.1 hypothetical protein [Labrenzia sp. EL_208]
MAHPRFKSKADRAYMIALFSLSGTIICALIAIGYQAMEKML